MKLQLFIIPTIRNGCRYAAALMVQRAVREFSRAARRYARQTAAALRLQAAARGWLARQAAARLRVQAAAETTMEEHMRQAAMAVIAPWAAAFRDRAHFLALRRAFLAIFLLELMREESLLWFLKLFSCSKRE